MEFGILTLIPPIFMVVFALITRKTASSLLITILLCFVMMHGINFLYPFVDLVYSVTTSSDTIWLLMFMALLSAILALMELAGAKRAFAKLVGRFATTQRRAMICNWLLAFPVFIDDVMGSAVKSTMIPIYNELKIPRAAMAYINDGTASPLAIMIPITAWGAFYQGVFGGYEELAFLGSGWDMYIHSIPFMFYGWAALLVSLLFALGIIPPLGDMKKAFQRAEQTGQLWLPESDKWNLPVSEGGSMMDEEPTKRDLSNLTRLLCFFVPVVLIVVVTFIAGDIVIGFWIAFLAMIPVYYLIGVNTWSKLMNACVCGVKDVLPVMIIVLFAYMLRDSLTALGLPGYVISVVEPIMSPALLPMITFIVCAILTFTTGSNWGIIVVTASVVVPLCMAVGGNPYLCIAALISGGGFGAHVCFYTDITVLVSSIAKIDNMEHALTQLPYGAIGAALATIAFGVAGFALPF